jgi:hypothetical protein
MAPYDNRLDPTGNRPWNPLQYNRFAEDSAVQQVTNLTGDDISLASITGRFSTYRAVRRSPHLLQLEFWKRIGVLH